LLNSFDIQFSPQVSNVEYNKALGGPGNAGGNGGEGSGGGLTSTAAAILTVIETIGGMKALLGKWDLLPRILLQLLIRCFM
jgi:hypothetical protein